MVRTIIDVVEEQVDELAAPGDEQQLREAVLRYSREIAFGAAQVYARAAEARGAWDARLEALVVDALVRGEADDALQSRAAALGWVGDRPARGGRRSRPPRATSEDVVDEPAPATPAALGGDAARRRPGRPAGRGARRQRPRPAAPCATLAGGRFGPGPVVVGPVGPRPVRGRPLGPRPRWPGCVAARAWPDAPRPVLADDLLPERAADGDEHRPAALVERGRTGRWPSAAAACSRR